MMFDLAADLAARLVPCPHCGIECFRMGKAVTGDGLPLLRDVDQLERRIIRAGMTPAEYAARRWPQGSLGALHYCCEIKMIGRPAPGTEVGHD